LKGHTWEQVTMYSPVLEVLRTLKKQNTFDVYLN